MYIYIYIYIYIYEEETGYYTHELAFWGGDLPSLSSKLGHVRGLADVLYLQPVAEAFSNHKYDASDYLRPDKKQVDRAHIYIYI